MTSTQRPEVPGSGQEAVKPKGENITSNKERAEGYKDKRRETKQETQGPRASWRLGSSRLFKNKLIVFRFEKKCSFFSQVEKKISITLGWMYTTPGPL